MKFIKYIFLGSTFFFYECNSIKTPQRAIATVICPRYTKTFSRGTIVEYHANNKRFTASASYIRNLAVGEKFEIVYDSLSPYINEVLIEAPVFLPGEKVFRIKGTIIRCVIGTYTKVFFKYKVRGKTYKKFQFIEGFHFLKKGDNYYVDCWEKNPQRSIIRFNKKCDNS